MWLKHVSWTLCHPNIKAYYTALRFYGGSWGLQDFIKGENCKKKKKMMIHVITEYVNSDSKVLSNIHMYHICLLLGLYPHFCGSEHGMYWCSWVTNKWKLSCNLIRYTGFPQKIMLKEQQSTFYSKKSMPLLNSARNDKFLYFYDNKSADDRLFTYMCNIFHLPFHHLFHFHTVHCVRRGFYV